MRDQKKQRPFQLLMLVVDPPEESQLFVGIEDTCEHERLTDRDSMRRMSARS
jgi:hypothetical protein